MKRLALWLGCAAAAWAAPALTTIQDVLYKADGTLFNGLLIVEWNSFEAADGSNIAKHSVNSPIVNGVLRVELTPTSTAVTPGACYSVKYNSDGKIQFQETWAVPPGTGPLRVRDVRIATQQGGIIEPPGTTQISEADVAGLLDDLAVRPVKGPGYAPSRAVFANAMGALESILGGASDCVRVDGTSGPCYANYVDDETPWGVIDGSNAMFTLATTPYPEESLRLYRNGLLQKAVVDYSAAGATIVFTSVSIPQTGDSLKAEYRQ
jgi:hypothetical protein